MESSVGLKVLSQSSFPGPVSRDLLAISPTIDLSVSVGDDGSTLYIRRPGGDLVSKLTERGRTVQALRWKADGQFLAVAWSGGVVRLMSLENSKAVHTLNVSVDSDPNIKYIGWARNLTGKRGFGKSKAAAGSWRRLLSQQGFEKDEEKELLDLPHELTFLEVDTALPKLSPLPVSGGSGDDMFVFSTRTSLEFVFQPMKAEDADKVDVMILGTADGGIQLSLYDTFVIGTFGYPPRRQSLKDLPAAMRLYSHASHGSISTHSLLLTEAQAKGDPVALHLVPIDLPFIHSSPVNLALLASKTTTLQKLLRYVKQTQVHMVGEWQAARELPARFIAGVQEELEKLPGGTMTIIQALFHTVLTGHTFPAVREWLVDTLAERGHKRWDKAVMSGLENLRGLVHENMIPALERCAVILSRLQGLAKFHEDTEDIGFKSSQITRIMDVVSCLTLVSHKILLLVMEELDLFTVFSSWLRLQIDKLASPSQSEELSEKEATMDYSKVLAYIEGHLQVSPLGLFLNQVAPEDWSRDWEYIEDGVSLLEMLDKQLQKYEEGSPHMKAFPRLDFLVDYLATRASTVFEGIAETQKRCVRFGQGTRLDIGSPISKADIRVVPLPRDEGIDSLTFTALVPQTEPSYLYIFRTSVHIINGISSSVWTQAAGLDLAGGRIIDAKFLGDETLLVLWRSSSSSVTEGGPQAAAAAAAAAVKLVAVPLQDTRLPYKGYIEGSAVEAPVPVSVADSGWWSADVPVEKAGGSSVPSAMEVVGPSSARGEMPARVCLLGKDRVTFKVFGLPDKLEA